MAQLLAEFTKCLESWNDSIRDPHEYQMKILQNLVEEYSKTEYGEKLGGADIRGIYIKPFGRICQEHNFFRTAIAQLYNS